MPCKSQTARKTAGQPPLTPARSFRDDNEPARGGLIKSPSATSAAHRLVIEATFAL